MLSISASAASLIDELTALVEPMRGGARRRPPLVLVEQNGEYECFRIDRNGLTLLARGLIAALGDAKLPRDMLTQRLEVRLDGSRVLSKILQLPAASRLYMDAIVAHQLDRMTPWTADRVVFDYALAADAPAAKDQVAVRLVATSRDVFDGTMSRLTAAGLKPAVVGTSEDPLDQPSAVNLLHQSRTERRQALRRMVAGALIGILVLGAAASALSGWRLYRVNAEADAVQAGVAAARQQIEAARAATELTENQQRLLAQKRDSVPVVLLLDRLSELIPASTYLTELAIEDQEVRITGFSGDAPALIGILEAAETLTDVRFGAPTTREEDATLDRFEIVARLPAPAEEAP